MNQNAAIVIQIMGGFVAFMGLICGFSSDDDTVRLFAAVVVPFGIGAIFSKSGRYRSGRTHGESE